MAAAPLKDPASLELQVISIGKSRQVVSAKISRGKDGTAWEAVVAGVPGRSDPEILFQGETGFTTGEYGERTGAMVVVSEADTDGIRRVVIGERREDIALCGRPTVLAPQLVLATDLALHPAKVQRLPVEERARAPRLLATLADPAAPALPGILRATAASSAVGSPTDLTDGKLETAWAENRGGDGKGEFVTMLVPQDLPLAGVDLVIRPTGAARPHSAAPRELWIAGAGPALFHVTVPVEAWDQPGAAYTVQFPAPITTDCLALVTETGSRADTDTEITVAELRGRPALNGQTVAELVARLAGGEASGQTAGVLLRALGEPGFQAIAQAFSKLDEGARRVALDVIDDAPCELSSPVYVKALIGRYEAQRVHAEARLTRCGEAAATALVKALDRGLRHENALRVTDQLARVAPGKAIEALVSRVEGATAANRGVFRIALARAASRRESLPAIRAALGNAALGPEASLDLLRALGPHLRELLPHVSPVFSRLSLDDKDFRKRYLLLEPAAEMADSLASAATYLEKHLTQDPSPYVRAQAAQLVRGNRVPAVGLMALLKDNDVRVREAAARKLGELQVSSAGSELARLLKDDDWPLVRASAASSLARLGPNPELDQALLQALRDESSFVKAPTVAALAARGVVSSAKALRKKLNDQREDLRVRTAAATALGRLCAQDSADTLTEYALRLADPLDSSDSKQLAPAALTALGRLGPTDLRQRLAPLLSAQAPRLAQSLAHEALAHRGECRAPAGAQLTPAH